MCVINNGKNQVNHFYQQTVDSGIDCWSLKGIVLVKKVIRFG